MLMVIRNVSQFFRLQKRMRVEHLNTASVRQSRIRDVITRSCLRTADVFLNQLLGRLVEQKRIVGSCTDNRIRPAFFDYHAKAFKHIVQRSCEQFVAIFLDDGRKAFLAVIIGRHIISICLHLLHGTQRPVKHGLPAKAEQCLFWQTR